MNFPLYKPDFVFLSFMVKSINLKCLYVTSFVIASNDLMDEKNFTVQTGILFQILQQMELVQ